MEIGPRVAGTAGETRARDYIRATLEGYGYDVSLQQFGFDASAFRPARVDAGTAAIPAYAFKGSGSGAVSGPLVAAGIGKPEEFTPRARGAIVLIERGELTFSQKVGNAIAAGATAAIIFNNTPGNLLKEITGGDASFPVVGITEDAGAELRQRAGATALQATVTVSPPQGTGYNVVARPRGAPTCATVTGGHYDSVPVTGGADDNASGTAAVLEVARVAAAGRLPGANCFVLFSAEEFGLFGSKSFVRELDDTGRNALRAMINLDVVGLDEGLTLIGSPDLIDTARIAAEKLAVDATASTLPQGLGSDHLSFENAGIPVVMLYRDDTAIHTPTDALGRISPASLRDAVRVAVATLQALNRP